MSKEHKQNNPNIIYILMDDMGFSDLGCYGSEIETPHINSLTEDGIRYNNFHVTPLCSPTRASILTGRNHHSVGMANITNFDLGPEYPNTRGRVSHNAGMLSEILKDQGYGTFAVGKWHLAPVHHASPAGPYDYWPLGKGFQRFYGFMEGETDQFHPDLVYDNHFIPTPNREGYHLSEDLVDHAKQFITDHVSVVPEKPFFLYLSFGAQHVPHQAPLEYIQKYQGKYDVGWDIVRENRYKKQKELGIIPEDAVLPPHNPGVRHWDELGSDEQKVAARLMEIYAGFLTHTDAQVGQLLEHLERIGKMDDTIIVFISDNGASSTGRKNGSIDYSKIVEGAEDTLEELLEEYDNLYGDRVSCEYPNGWAQVCNTPLRFYKQTSYFGGTRVPLIVKWPKGDFQDQEVIRNQFHYVTDITPTMLDILNIEAPSVIKGVEQIPMHGQSMRYTFEDAHVESTKTTQHFAIWGHRGMIHDGWKAVTFHHPGSDFKDDVWELINIREDFTESNNLAEQYPEKLQELIDLWWIEAEKYDVLPLENISWKDITRYNPESVTDRTTFVYYGGMTHIGSAAAPPTVNCSYTMTVFCEREDTMSEGVLVAFGNYDGGYTLYIKENKLHFEYNHFRIIYALEGQGDVPTGKLKITYQFDKKLDSIGGTGTLYINDQKIAEREFPKTHQSKISRKGLSLGYDSTPTVTLSYYEEFPFSGTIDRIEFVLDKGKDQAVGSEMNKQEQFQE